MQGSPEVGRGARYGLANAWTGARTRLATRRHLRDRGLRPGWSCLEVGAGGGSVASWLAEAVGPSGEVLATDIDPCHVEPFATDTLRVLRHDVARGSRCPARGSISSTAGWCSPTSRNATRHWSR